MSPLFVLSFHGKCITCLSDLHVLQQFEITLPRMKDFLFAPQFYLSMHDWPRKQRRTDAADIYANYFYSPQVFAPILRPLQHFLLWIKGTTRCSWRHIALLWSYRNHYHDYDLMPLNSGALTGHSFALEKVVKTILKHHTDCFACLQYMFHMSVRGTAPFLKRNWIGQKLRPSHLIRANQMSQSSRKFFSATYFIQETSSSQKNASSLLLTRLQELLFLSQPSPAHRYCLFLFGGCWLVWLFFLTGWDFCFYRWKSQQFDLPG